MTVVSSSRRILFIQDETIRMGGTKVLIKSLSECFLQEGYEIDVLIKTNEASAEVLKIFPASVRMVFFDPGRRRSWRFPFGLRLAIEKLKHEYEHIISLSVEGFFFSSILSGYYQLKGRQTYYVVNNQAMKSCFLTPLYKKILLQEPNSSFLFMNRECRDSLAIDIGKDFSKSKIVPLPVQERVPIVYKESEIRKIVSIGRIDPIMKTYNWNLIQEFVNLKNQGYQFEWHIYGGGELSDISWLQRKISANDTNDYIFYHGEMPYENLEVILSDAYLFIGMGTILVEAASLGIPSLAAIAYSKPPMCNGLFHDLPFGNVGEPSKHISCKNTIELVEFILNMDLSAYSRLRTDASLAASKYFTKNTFPLFKEILNVGELATPMRSIEKIKFSIYYFVLRLVEKIRKVRSVTG